MSHERTVEISEILLFLFRSYLDATWIPSIGVRVCFVVFCAFRARDPICIVNSNNVFEESVKWFVIWLNRSLLVSLRKIQYFNYIRGVCNSIIICRIKTNNVLFSYLKNNGFNLISFADILNYIDYRYIHGKIGLWRQV